MNANVSSIYSKFFVAIFHLPKKSERSTVDTCREVVANALEQRVSECAGVSYCLILLSADRYSAFHSSYKCER